jgi:TIR domain
MGNSAEQKGITATKVFVSYAQSVGRTEWIRQICERLRHDAVDLVADIYELPHGADIHAFMERSVNDPTITRVLMFCDKLYCEKANGRLGGVGKETQIISSEVYNRVDETKFLAIFCELSDDASPLLPTYLKSRLGIDFSSPEKVDENWETLIRDLFGKPLYQKPALGQPPAYITAPQQPSIGGKQIPLMAASGEPEFGQRANAISAISSTSDSRSTGTVRYNNERQRRRVSPRRKAANVHTDPGRAPRSFRTLEWRTASRSRREKSVHFRAAVTFKVRAGSASFRRVAGPRQ